MGISSPGKLAISEKIIHIKKKDKVQMGNSLVSFYYNYPKEKDIKGSSTERSQQVSRVEEEAWWYYYPSSSKFYPIQTGREVTYTLLFMDCHLKQPIISFVFVFFSFFFETRETWIL